MKHKLSVFSSASRNTLRCIIFLLSLFISIISCSNFSMYASIVSGLTKPFSTKRLSIAFTRSAGSDGKCARSGH